MRTFNEEALVQNKDGNWVKAIPLPNNYGDPIPLSTLNNAEAMLKMEMESGHSQNCVKCGNVIGFIGLSVCDNCYNKAVERKNGILREWAERNKKGWELDPTISTVSYSIVEDQYDERNGTGHLHDIGGD